MNTETERCSCRLTDCRTLEEEESCGKNCRPGQLDTDTLEHLNNLQAELDRTKAELREAKSGPDYKLLYDQLIEKMLSR